MHGRIPTDPQCAIFPAAQLCNEIEARNSTARLCSDDWFAALARKLWPKKPAASVQYLTGSKERACHYWIAGREPPGSVVVKLLHSNDGERVLDQIMRGCKEPWWLSLKRARIASRAYDSACEQLSLNLDC